MKEAELKLKAFPVTELVWHNEGKPDLNAPCITAYYYGDDDDTSIKYSAEIRYLEPKDNIGHSFDKFGFLDTGVSKVNIAWAYLPRTLVYDFEKLFNNTIDD